MRRRTKTSARFNKIHMCDVSLTRHPHEKRSDAVSLNYVDLSTYTTYTLAWQRYTLFSSLYIRNTCK